MYVVILGCGRMGAHLAEMLALEGANVVVVDKSPAALERLGPEFNGVRLLGNGIDVDVQRRAGVEKANAFVAMAADDNTNIMAAQVARHIFHVPKVVARLYEVENQAIYQRFGLEVISPTISSTREIRSIILAEGLVRFPLLDEGDIEIVRARLMSRRFQTVSQVNEAFGGVVSGIIDSSGARIAKADDSIQPGDELVITLPANAVRKLTSHFHTQGG
jgi:trk system potassium uptake protein TrkA